ncbi:MAG: DNA-directed RNA polymerase subunit K [Acidilobaceae archaeon]|nr:DNA-directed RNA polymerase subunit K [Acidilobaceae archaeon]MCX8165958.1 DNA-directed RNA polymerase subunit K [Acidilobaceae archaeon]MDW7974601.1 DNA-directed RNA polymerase subunit K [Sulfolobales archaeon]
MEAYSAYPRIREEIKVGPPKLTRFERARIISIRALQISRGAPPLLPPEQLGTSDPVEIAKKEVEMGLLPISILRYTSSGQRQSIPLSLLVKVTKEVVGKIE